MKWWSSVETLSKLLTCFTILAALLTCATAALKVRYDAIKKASDLRKADERKHLDTELKAKSAEALQATLELEQRTAARRITADQRGRFIHFLEKAPKGPVTMKFAAGNSESHGFALQLRSLLRDAGYTVAESMISETRFGAPLVGAQLELKNRDLPPKATAALQAGLEVIGIDALGVHGHHDQREEDIRLSVGEKP